jgi:hypothetical protein
VSIPQVFLIDSNHRKASLPTEIFNVPAEFALRLLLASRVYRLSSCRLPEQRSEDARRVLNACKALQQRRDQDNTVLDDAMVASARTLVATLSRDTLLKLSLITWHFDASLHSDASSYGTSPELARFLEQPHNDTIWEILYGRYQSHTGLQVSLPAFKVSHDFLLCPTMGLFSNEA